MGLCTLLPQLNLDQSIPTLSCLDHSIPPLNCLDHSIPFRSRYTVGTVWVLDQSYSVQNCLDLGIRNFLDQNPHPFLDLSHRTTIFGPELLWQKILYIRICEDAHQQYS